MHTNGTTKGARVDWSPEEQERLIDQLTTLRQNDPAENLTTLSNRVQEQWPQDRRRKLLTVRSEAWLIEGITKRLREQRDRAREVVQAKVHVEPEVVHVVADPRETLDNMDISTLGLEFATRLFSTMDDIVASNKRNHEMLQRILSRLPQIATPHAIHEHAKKQKRVCIVGLLPTQQHEIENEFRDRLALKFIDNDTSSARLPDADLYCIMTKFARHKWQYQVDDKDKLMYIGGATSDLIRSLERYLS